MKLNKEKTLCIEAYSHTLKQIINAIEKNDSDGSGLWKAIIENVFQDSMSYKIIIGIYGSYPFMDIELEKAIIESGGII